MDKIKVKLQDWLSGCCPYKGCTNNDGFGICTYEDEDFVDDLLSKIKSTYKSHREVNADAEFECKNIEVEYGCCEYCGSKLKHYKDMLPFGDTYIPYEYFECSEC